MWIVLALGCGLFDKTKENLENIGDDIAGLTDSTVVQASVLGVQEPTDPALAALIAATDFAPGTSVTVFVTDAAASDDMAAGLVTGATVSIEGLALAEDPAAEGLYLLTPEEGPAYDVGATWVLNLAGADGPSTGAVVLPPPAEGVLDTSGPGGSVLHGVNLPLAVDLGGLGFQSGLIVVIGPGGTPTYTNQPDTVDELYAASQSTDAGVLEIPASAFPSEGTYAVGVAGLQGNTGDDFDGFNTLLSKIRAGEMIFTPLIASP